MEIESRFCSNKVGDFSYNKPITQETQPIKRERGPGGEQRVLVTITGEWGEGATVTIAATWPGHWSQYWVR